jgi:hypothetical protein
MLFLGLAGHLSDIIFLPSESVCHKKLHPQKILATGPSMHDKADQDEHTMWCQIFTPQMNPDLC